MRVRLGTIAVDDNVRKAIAAHVGKSGKCTRADVRAFYLKCGDADLAVVVAEFDARIEPVLPFMDETPHESRAL
jgi:hypothetical protein